MFLFASSIVCLNILSAYAPYCPESSAASQIWTRFVEVCICYISPFILISTLRLEKRYSWLLWLLLWLTDVWFRHWVQQYSCSTLRRRLAPVGKVVSVPHSDLDSSVQHMQFCLGMSQVAVGEHRTVESETFPLRLPWTNHLFALVKSLTQTIYMSLTFFFLFFSLSLSPSLHHLKHLISF